mmetsp:Transcript_53737/g.149062  ORF Transcript_53737/g.149062 Transcript_53737/m.149062 type:complete len:238 (+) Transcript_53737:444-1157(+)
MQDGQHRLGHSVARQPVALRARVGVAGCSTVMKSIRPCRYARIVLSHHGSRDGVCEKVRPNGAQQPEVCRAGPRAQDKGIVPKMLIKKRKDVSAGGLPGRHSGVSDSKGNHCSLDATKAPEKDVVKEKLGGSHLLFDRPLGPQEGAPLLQVVLQMIRLGLYTAHEAGHPISFAAISRVGPAPVEGGNQEPLVTQQLHNVTKQPLLGARLRRQHRRCRPKLLHDVNDLRGILNEATVW